MLPFASTNSNTGPMPLFRAIPLAGISICEAAEIAARLKARFWVFGAWCKNVIDHAINLRLQRVRWRVPCQSFSTWERSRKRGTLWLIGDPPASLCPRSGSMPTRSSLFFSWSTMVPVINTTWPPPLEAKRTRSPGLRVACLPLLISAYMMERGLPHPARTSLVFAGLIARQFPVGPRISKRLTGVGAALGGLWVRKTEIIGLMDRSRPFPDIHPSE
jgi:hypothetical protein